MSRVSEKEVALPRRAPGLRTARPVRRAYEIAPVLGRSAATTRQLASRARRRVQGAAPAPDPDRARLRRLVDAFLAASRGGDFDALVAVLDPDAVACSDGGTLLRRGAGDVDGRSTPSG